MPLFTFDICSWGESLDWARGWRRDSRKHRPGSQLSSARPEGFRKGRRKPCGPASPHEKATASSFREARRCPRAPAGTCEHSLSLGFLKSEGRQGFFGLPLTFNFFRIKSLNGAQRIGIPSGFQKVKGGKDFLGARKAPVQEFKSLSGDAQEGEKGGNEAVGIA